MNKFSYYKEIRAAQNKIKTLTEMYPDNTVDHLSDSEKSEYWEACATVEMYYIEKEIEEKYGSENQLNLIPPKAQKVLKPVKSKSTQFREDNPNLPTCVRTEFQKEFYEKYLRANNYQVQKEIIREIEDQYNHPNGQYTLRNLKRIADYVDAYRQKLF